VGEPGRSLDERYRQDPHAIVHPVRGLDGAGVLSIPAAAALFPRSGVGAGAHHGAGGGAAVGDGAVGRVRAQAAGAAVDARSAPPRRRGDKTRARRPPAPLPPPPPAPATPGAPLVKTGRRTPLLKTLLLHLHCLPPPPFPTRTDRATPVRDLLRRHVSHRQ